MLVDDNRELLDVTGKQLEHAGFVVDIFDDPQKAFQAFADHPVKYDVVITDMAMPHLTGTKLIEKLLKVRNDITVYLCTGYSERINETSSLEMGARRYYEKPVDMSQLISDLHLDLSR